MPVEEPQINRHAGAGFTSAGGPAFVISSQHLGSPCFQRDKGPFCETSLMPALNDGDFRGGFCDFFGILVLLLADAHLQREYIYWQDYSAL